MLVPRLPRDDDAIWGALAVALRGGTDFHVVHRGALVLDENVGWDDRRVSDVLESLRSCALRFVSARHDRPLAPHFAVTINNDDLTADLHELVVMRFQGDGPRPAARELLHDLGIVAVSLSVARPSLLTLRAPLSLAGPLPEGFTATDGGVTVDLRAV